MTNRVYIGWDAREDIAYQVAKFSIEKYNHDIEVKPLKLHELKDMGFVTRPDDLKASTQFTFTRFLVPFLNDFKGWAIFIDCDFLIRDDIQHLIDLADPTMAVQVVKHEYNVVDGVVKMDGQVQHAYPRKNWSSCILFNCAHPSNQVLTPEFLNKQEMSYLHRFNWLQDHEIGNLPHQWNYLVGHYHDGGAKAVHYTLGTPFMPGYETCDYAEEWFETRTDYYKSW